MSSRLVNHYSLYTPRLMMDRRATSTSYSMNFPDLTRGTVWHRPYISVAHVPATVRTPTFQYMKCNPANTFQVQKVWKNRNGIRVCSTGSYSKYDVHLPRTLCEGCEGDGLWGKCFYRDISPCTYSTRGRENMVPKGGMICPAGW